MFFPRPTAPRFREASLHQLRLSLNAPVIATESLPHGPARAAIAVSRTSQGGYKLAIAVRSLRARQLAVYAPEEPFEDEAAAAVALDAALTFAEGMGFLFDDDELAAPAPDARARAFARWRELVSDTDDETDDPLARTDGGGRAAASAPELRAAPRAPRMEPPETAPDPGRDVAAAGPVDGELVLEDAIVEGPRPEVSAPAAASTAPEALASEAKPAAKRSLTLTKFRGLAAAAPGAGPGAEDESTGPAASADAAKDRPEAPPPSAKAVLITPHGPALGRLQLVKRRRGHGVQPGPSWLQRLLGSF